MVALSYDGAVNARSDSARTSAAWIRSYAIAALVLAAGGVAARVSSAYVDLRFPDRPAPSDLLFRLLPNVPWTQYLGDIALLAGLALLTWHALRHQPHDGPGMIALAGVVQITRAAINTLTPLATPLGNGTQWGLVDYVQNGMFPSGHAATALLFYLVVDETKAPRMKRAMLWLVAIEVLALLLSRGHYSIDIVGGLLLVYVLEGVWRSGAALSWLRRLVTP